MEKYSYEKIKKEFPKITKMFGETYLFGFFENLNNYATTCLYLNRVQEHNFSSEKLIYQASMRNASENDFVYVGLLKTDQDDILSFKLKSDNLLSAHYLLSFVKNNIKENHPNIEEYDEHKFELSLRQFDSIRRSDAQSFLYSLTSSFSEIINYGEKNPSKKQKEAYAEYLHFKHRYIKHFLTGSQLEKFKSFIFNERDLDILKIEKNMFSRHRNTSYKLISNKLKTVSMNELKSFYKDYPLLISLYLGYIKEYPEKEALLASRLLEESDPSLSFIENLQNFFKLTDKEMSNLKGLSWQKHLMLKNRPIVLLEMLKAKASMKEIKNRKESLALYVGHYYFKSGQYFKESEDYKDLVELNVSRKDYFKLRDMIVDSYTGLLSLSNRYEIKINKRSDVESIVDSVLGIRNLAISTSLFKDYFVFDGYQFETTKTKKGVFIKSDCGVYSIKIDIKMLSDKRIVLEWKTQNETNIDSLKSKMTEVINQEFSRMGNKRYPRTQILSLNYLFNYFIDNFKRNDLKKKEHYFYPRKNRKTNKIIDNETKLYSMKEKKSLLEMV